MLVDTPFANLETFVKACVESGRLGPGRNFYVGNGTAQHGQRAASDSTNRGLSPSDPLATVDYAVGLCTAGRGDNIIVLPGHVEAFTAAAGVTLDVAGVTILGIGRGTLRPQLNIGASAAAGTDIDVTAANCRIDNIFCELTATDAVDRFLSIAAADFTLANCYMRLQDSDGQVNIGVEVATGADRCTIENCTFFGNVAGATTDTAITVSAAVSEFTMKNCKVDMIGGASPGCVEFTAAALNCHFENCTFANRVASATTTIDCNANAVTGQAVNCYHVLGTIATAGSGILPIESTGQAAYIALFENYCVNDQAAGGAGEAGALVGAVSS